MSYDVRLDHLHWKLSRVHQQLWLGEDQGATERLIAELGQLVEKFRSQIQRYEIAEPWLASRAGLEVYLRRVLGAGESLSIDSKLRDAPRRFDPKRIKLTEYRGSYARVEHRKELYHPGQLGLREALLMRPDKRPEWSGVAVLFMGTKIKLDCKEGIVALRYFPPDGHAELQFVSIQEPLREGEPFRFPSF